MREDSVRAAQTTDTVFSVNLFREIICTRFDNNQEHKSTGWKKQQPWTLQNNICIVAIWL